eukprot:14940513-Heterocapsa_arctica.AAC.1
MLCGSTIENGKVVDGAPPLLSSICTASRAHETEATCLQWQGQSLQKHALSSSRATPSSRAVLQGHGSPSARRSPSTSTAGEYGHIATSATSEAIDLGGIDQIESIAKQWADSVEEDGRVMDLKQAYKLIAQSPALAPLG